MRIDAEVDNQLRQLAAERSVSVNTLTAKALARYIEWDSFGEKFGLTDMPASIIQKMISCLDDDGIKELARWAGSTLLREQILFWFKAVTPHAVLEAYPRLASRYGRLFEYVERAEGADHVIVIKHTGGPKLSMLYGEIIREAFDKLLALKVTVEVTENQVVARFALPPGTPRPAPPVRPGAAAGKLPPSAPEVLPEGGAR